jgi:hypothetical protein
MKIDRVHFQWQLPSTAPWKSAVCLHGHTLHSREHLSFLPRYVSHIPGGRWWLRRCAARIDFSRGYWTPPLTATSAFALERAQIAALGLSHMVSLTDHDDIEAGLSLQVTHRRAEAPISVEWTVPFRGSIFHIGVHNLPAGFERPWASAMTEYTAGPDESLLPALIEGLSRNPETLIVLNHPCWIEEGIAEAVHTQALRSFLQTYAVHLHAVELNGTRVWRENRAAITLADAHGLPVISGGDRHSCEPSACINLTNAATFSEFAAEVRARHSTVLFLSHYQEPMAGRVADATWDVLRPYPEYPGRERWTDRVFYPDENGVDQPLSKLWNDGVPLPARLGAGIIELAATIGLRSALRALVTYRAEAL